MAAPQQTDQSLGCFGVDREFRCGLDRGGKPIDLRGSGHSKAHFPSESQNTIVLDAFNGEKTQRPLPKRLALHPTLMSGTSTLEDVAAVRTVVLVPAMGALQAVNCLAGEAFGWKPCLFNDTLSMPVLIPRVGALKPSHSSISNTRCHFLSSRKPYVHNRTVIRNIEHIFLLAPKNLFRKKLRNHSFTAPARILGLVRRLR